MALLVEHEFENVADVWPAGTSVGLYDDPGRDVTAPTAAVLDTEAVAADGSLTFGGLTPGKRYLAYALGRKRTFMAEELGDFDERVQGLDLSVAMNRAFEPGGTLDAPDGGQVQRIYHLVVVEPGQTNGSRGDDIDDDAANATDHSSLVGYEFRSTGSASFAERGSFHQTYWALRVAEHADGEGIYCEGFAQYVGVVGDRKGALLGPAEWKLDIQSGKPARASGHRIIVQEFNALAAYDAATFGAGSDWIDTGARGWELLSQGAGAQPLGTGMYLAGAAGFVRFLAFNSGGVERFVVDGTGFLTIRRAGATQTLLRSIVNTGAGDQAHPMVLMRADGKLLYSDGTNPADAALERSGAAVLTVTGTLRATVGLGTQNVGAATPTGGAAGDIRVGDGKIWARDGAGWKSVAIA